MNTHRFSSVTEQDKNGYFVRCPELQGCYSQGDTECEALANIKDAIKTYLAMDAIVMKDAKVREMEVFY